MAPSNRLKLLNFEIKELKYVHELSNKNGWEKGPKCFSFPDVEHIFRISWQTTNQQQCTCTYQHVLTNSNVKPTTNSLERRVQCLSTVVHTMRWRLETGVINILIPVKKMPCRPFLQTGGYLEAKNIFSLPSSSYLICHKPETSLTRVHCHRTASQTLYVQI